MNQRIFDTISEAIDTLTDEGFKEDFKPGKKRIIASYSRKEYPPKDLTIVESLRFEGMTNPGDAALVLAIVAKDGTKGTMVTSYAADHNQGEELIKEIPFAN